MKKTALTLALVFALLISLMVVVQSAESSSKTIVVPDDYPTIQKAINDASAGDTVFVRNGSYKERITIDKPLSLIGENPENTIVGGAPIMRFTTSFVIKVTAENVMITGFTVKDDYIGIWVDIKNYQLPPPSRCKIIRNNIENNFVDGISISSGQDQFISENNITGNGNRGISISAPNSVISENYITGNGGAGISAVLIDSTLSITISRNSIAGNGISAEIPEPEGGLSLRGNGPFYVYGNNITDNQGYGIRFEGCSKALVYQNNIEHNRIGINLGNFIFTSELTAGSGNVVFNNNLIDNSQNAFVEHANPYNISNIAGAIGNGTDIVSWDNGREGNYWNDYQSRYPNAAEVDTSGIGGTPYVIDENNADHYPLMQQVDVSTASPPPSTPLSFLTALIAGAAITLVVVGVVLLIYFKKRKR